MLESYAQDAGIELYKTSRLLAQKLRSTHVARDFIVETRVEHGQKFYRIWDRNATRLTSVPATPPTPAGEANPFEAATS
jgi:hypothetical protein